MKILKILRITMEDGSVWEVPALPIAQLRADDYAERNSADGDWRDSEWDDEVESALTDDYDLGDYARNNMNWSDVVKLGAKCVTEPTPPDYEQLWCNAECELAERAEGGGR